MAHFFVYMKDFNTPSYIFDAVSYGTSHRETDGNGRLLVKKTLLTKGCVSPYYGQEIPNYQELGLDPNKKYNVYRPIEELQKALQQFDGIPLLNKHIMDYADAPNRENWAGCVSNPVIDGNNVYGDLAVWNKGDIDNIEDGSKKDLSVGYRSTFIKESGEFDGTPYDLKMVNIIPNHLALVEKGRVKGAYVFDEQKGVGMFQKLASIFKKLGVQDSDIKELEDEFKESDHPRDKGGKFTSGSGSASSSKETNASKADDKPKSSNSGDDGLNKAYAEFRQFQHSEQGHAERRDMESGKLGVGPVGYFLKKTDELAKKHGIDPEKFRDFYADKIQAEGERREQQQKNKMQHYLNREFGNKSNGASEDAAPDKETKMDKRDAIRQILAIAAKPADQFQGGEEERERTIAEILEKIAYNPSEAGKADDEAANKELVEGSKQEEVDVNKIKDEAKEEAKREFAEIAKAKEEVEDVAGKCGVQDSAEAYYKIGLQALGIETKGIMDSDLKAMFHGAKAIKKAQKTAVVMDADFSKTQSDKVKETLAKLPARKY